MFEDGSNTNPYTLTINVNDNNEYDVKMSYLGMFKYYFTKEIIIQLNECIDDESFYFNRDGWYYNKYIWDNLVSISKNKDYSEASLIDVKELKYVLTKVNSEIDKMKIM